MLQANRDHDCLAQFKSCHLVGIVGTNRALDNSVQQGKLGHCNRLQWAKGDPCTGLELWVHRRYITPKHFRGHWSGEGELRGRVGAARFKTPQISFALWRVFQPTILGQACQNAFANGCASWCRNMVIAVFLLFSWMGMRISAWTRSLACSMLTPCPSLRPCEQQIRRRKTQMGGYCVSLLSATIFVLATLFFVVALPSTLMMADPHLGWTISSSLGAPKSSLVKCGTALEMRCSLWTATPDAITDHSSSMSPSDSATVPQRMNGIVWDHDKLYRCR